jgi:hypothetical protein
MNAEEIRFHLRDRLKAVEEIEREEHWQKLNAIVRFVIETGMKRDGADGESEVFVSQVKSIQ